MPSSHRTFLLLPLVHQVSSGDHDSGFTPTPLNINFRSDVLDLGFKKKKNLNLYFLLFCHSAPSRGEEPPVDGGGRNFTRNDKEEKEEEEEEEGGASG